jgi:hypothetical protein
MAKEASARNIHSTLIVFMVTTQETTFALTIITEFNLGGYIMTRTGYRKPFVLETQRDRTLEAR